MQLGYPLTLDGSGRTAQADEDRHIRDLVAQVLFTSPGERVNRPDFGSGLRQLIFAGAGDDTLVAAQFLVQGALQEWLGDLIDVEAVAVRSEQEVLHVTMQYTVHRTEEEQVVELTTRVS